MNWTFVSFAATASINAGISELFIAIAWLSIKVLLMLMLYYNEHKLIRRPLILHNVYKSEIYLLVNLIQLSTTLWGF